jgi:ubiquinone/menaquinone biosynthesis C-methylase UbiE
MTPLNNAGSEKSPLSHSEVQPELIFKTHWGFAASQALAVATDLNIFTAIHAKYETVEKLSKYLNLQIRPLKILLDALVGIGFLTKSKIFYKLTPESKMYLVKGEPRYLGSILSRTNKNFETWMHLGEAVRSGRPIGNGDEEEVGQFFTQLAKDIFPGSYSSAIVAAKKLGAGNSLKGLKILDIACGSGAWSLPFALNDKTTRVAAQDLPSVLDLTRQYVKRFRLENQYEYLPGDLHQMEFGRARYDLVILGHICHGIGETESKKLFKKSYEALKPKGRLVIAEFVPNDLRTADQVTLLFALQMLIDTPQGDVFTVKELKRWLTFSGFKKVNTLKVIYPATVVVATK